VITSGCHFPPGRQSAASSTDIIYSNSLCGTGHALLDNPARLTTANFFYLVFAQVGNSTDSTESRLYASLGLLSSTAAARATELFSFVTLCILNSAAGARANYVIWCWQSGMWVLPIHILALAINLQRTYVFLIPHPTSLLQFILSMIIF
jgi:hypothetical protein